MAGKPKKRIYEPDFLSKVRNATNKEEITLRFGDIKQLLKASERVIKFAAKTEIFSNGTMYLDTTEMYESFVRVKQIVNKEKGSIASKARDKIESEYEIKDITDV